MPEKGYRENSSAHQGSQQVDALTGILERETVMKLAEELYASENVLPLSVIIGDINNLKNINFTYGFSEGNRMIQETGRVFQDTQQPNQLLGKSGEDEFVLFLPKTSSQEAYTILQKIQGDVRKNLSDSKNQPIALNVSFGYATQENSGESWHRVLKKAYDYLYKQKLLEETSSLGRWLHMVQKALYEKDSNTAEHGNRMADLSVEIGRRMNLGHLELTDLNLLARLHDLGKIGVAEQTLNSPKELTEEQWAEIKRHPEIGSRMVREVPELDGVAFYILCHHERWDGTGYPLGLSGENIPLLSRIVSTVDAYDAMTSDRPYRKALPKEAALEELKRGMGSQWDPLVARTAIEYLEGRHDDYPGKNKITLVS